MVNLRAPPSGISFKVCTLPFPNDLVPMSTARFVSLRAPAVISEALAEYSFISTTSGRRGWVAPDPRMTSGARLRFCTVTMVCPRGRNRLQTSPAASMYPPPLFRTSRMMPWAPDFSRRVRADPTSEPVSLPKKRRRM